MRSDLKRRRTTSSAGGGRRLGYANVMATIAVFLSLGGISWAALELPANSVGPRQLRPKAVTAKALGIPLGARSYTDRRVHELPNPTPGCSEIPPGGIPPPCAPPPPRPLTSMSVQTTAPGLLVVSALIGALDEPADDIASVQITASVDGKAMPDSASVQLAGDSGQLSYQNALRVPEGRHSVELQVSTSDSRKVGKVVITPVSLVAFSLPALAGARG